MNSNKNIVFGGSFDPPHICHVNLALTLQQRLSVKKIFVVPSGDHPEKDNEVSFADRKKMCELAFRHLGVDVLSIENRLSSPTYTFDTLKRLKDARGFSNLYFVVGSDLIHEIPDWAKAQKIKEIATFLVVPRQGYPITNPPNVIGDYEKLDIGYELPQLSSTHIREILNAGGDASTLLDKKVNEYIDEESLYSS